MADQPPLRRPEGNFEPVTVGTFRFKSDLRNHQAITSTTAVVRLLDGYALADHCSPLGTLSELPERNRTTPESLFIMPGPSSLAAHVAAASDSVADCAQ
jgi:hypothetical protein